MITILWINHSIPSFVLSTWFRYRESNWAQTTPIRDCSLQSLVSADVGECRWEMHDQEATQQCDDLWPDEVLQAGVTHKGWSTHTMTGMIGRWWCFSSHPSPTSSFQFPLDHHDGSNKVETSREGCNQFKFKSIQIQVNFQDPRELPRSSTWETEEEEGGMRWYNPTQAFTVCFVVFIDCTVLTTLSFVFTLLFRIWNRSFPSQLHFYQRGSVTGNLTGLTNTNLFLREHALLVSAVVGKCRWEMHD